MEFDMSADLMTECETAKVLRVSNRTLQRYRVSGNGPRFVKLGKRVFYRYADINSYIEARVVESTSQVECR